MINAEKQEQEPTAAEALGVYLAAVSVCNTKLARYMASVIERAGDQAAREVDPATWKIAQALTIAFYGDNDLGLPANPVVQEQTSCEVLDMLSAHIEVKRHLTERAEDGNVLAKLKACKAYDCELDIAGILIQADHMLVELFDGSFAKPDERDDKMAQILEALDIRGLKAPSIWLRMVLAARRLLAGLPVTDDVAFGELDALRCVFVTIKFSCLGYCWRVGNRWRRAAGQREVPCGSGAQARRRIDCVHARKRVAAGARGVPAQYVAGIGSRRGGAARH